MEWDFRLTFALPLDGQEPTSWLDALHEAGCDDATVGIGKAGSIALDFSRQADSAEAAVKSAVKDVGRAIPGSVLVEVWPAR